MHNFLKGLRYEQCKLRHFVQRFKSECCQALAEECSLLSVIIFQPCLQERRKGVCVDVGGKKVSLNEQKDHIAALSIEDVFMLLLVEPGGVFSLLIWKPH